LRKETVVNYAKRMHEKYSLDIPVDVIGLAEKYGDLKFVDIPFEIDGVAANLKKAGIRPTILVNKNRPKTRQRFTIAHEIGHVIIPWHMGTIFDITNGANSDGTIDYWEMEAEANAFATELLMPTAWIEDLIKKTSNPAKLNERIAKKAEVSPIAATLRLRSILSPGYIFIVYGGDGVVSYSGRSDGTYASPPQRGEGESAIDRYEYAEEIYEFYSGRDRYLWLKLPSEVELHSVSQGDWREILEEIVSEVSGGEEQKIKYKQKLNGVLGYANGVIRRGNYNEKSLCSICIQRLAGNEQLEPITSHPKFKEFLSSKVRDLIEKARG
jgi:Zn-dependent peptidase ImmA (M78 family)